MKNEHKMLIRYTCILYTFCTEQSNCDSCIFKEEDNDCLLSHSEQIEIKETFNDEEKNLARFANMFNKYCNDTGDEEPCIFTGGQICENAECPFSKRPKRWDIDEIKALLREDRQDDR